MPRPAHDCPRVCSSLFLLHTAPSSSRPGYDCGFAFAFSFGRGLRLYLRFQLGISLTFGLRVELVRTPHKNRNRTGTEARTDPGLQHRPPRARAAVPGHLYSYTEQNGPVPPAIIRVPRPRQSWIELWTVPVGVAPAQSVAWCTPGVATVPCTRWCLCTGLAGLGTAAVPPCTAAAARQCTWPPPHCGAALGGCPTGVLHWAAAALCRTTGPRAWARQRGSRGGS